MNTFTGPETSQDLKIFNLENVDNECLERPRERELQELSVSNIEENLPPKISKSYLRNIHPVYRKDLLSFIALVHLLIGQFLGFCFNNNLLQLKY